MARSSEQEELLDIISGNDTMKFQWLLLCFIAKRWSEMPGYKIMLVIDFLRSWFSAKHLQNITIHSLQLYVMNAVLSIGPNTHWSSGSYPVETWWVFYCVQVKKSVEILLGFSHYYGMCCSQVAPAYFKSYWKHCECWQCDFVHWVNNIKISILTVVNLQQCYLFQEGVSLLN